jgi:peptide/nickel transport system substrate-binding protein
MSKLSVRLISIVLLAVMLLSACSPAAQPAAQPNGAAPTEAAAPTADTAQKPADGEKLYVTVSDQLNATWVRNFNPFSPNALGPTLRGVYEPMMIFNFVKGELVPWLATEYKFNDDNTVLTVKLRENVKWSDGEPFTAKDVIFTFNLMENTPALAGTATAVLADYVDSYSATDDYTVVFKFKKVYTLAVYDLMGQVMVPEHIWSTIEDPATYTNDNPVATGPFTQVATFESQIYILEKNPNYWQEGKPAFDGLRFPAWPGNDQANMELVNGNVDWAGNFVPDIVQTFVSKNPAHFGYFFAEGDATNLYLNHNVEPFGDPEVRKAISMALNREMMVDTAMFGYTPPLDATGLSAGYATWKNQAAVEKGTWANYNPEAAAARLDELGYKKGSNGIRMTPDGKPMKYDLIVVSGWTDWISTCQIIAQNLKDIGIEVTVLTPEFNAWYDTLSKGDFQMAISWSSGGATPYNYYRGMMSRLSVQPRGESASENWHRYVNEDADKLLEEFSTTSDAARQKEIMAQIQDIFIDTAPVLPLFPGPQWFEYNSSRLTGWPTKDNPYAAGSPFLPTSLIIMTNLVPAQ